MREPANPLSRLLAWTTTTRSSARRAAGPGIHDGHGVLPLFVECASYSKGWCGCALPSQGQVFTRGLHTYYPFTHRLRPRRRAPAPSEPSTVAARLHAISSTCRLAGPLPGTSARSHSAYSCPGGRLAHVCCLRKDVDHVLAQGDGDELWLEEHGRLEAAAAQVLSQPCQRAARSPFPCVGRVLPIPCSSSRRVLTLR